MLQLEYQVSCDGESSIFRLFPHTSCVRRLRKVVFSTRRKLSPMLRVFDAKFDGLADSIEAVGSQIWNCRCGQECEAGGRNVKTRRLYEVENNVSRLVL